MAFFVLAKFPPYVVRQHGTLFFRIVVPENIRNIVGLKEIRYSLKTNSTDEASKRVKYIAPKLKLLFRTIRQSNLTMNRFSKEELQKLIQQYIHSVVDSFEIIRIDPPSPWEYSESQRRLFHLKEHHQAELVRNDHSSIRHEAEQLLSRCGIDQAPSEFAFKELCREILKAWEIISDINLLRDNGIYVPVEDSIKHTRISHTTSPCQSNDETANSSQEKTDSVPIIEVIKTYTEEQRLSDSWQEKTEKENLACYQLFLDFAGKNITTDKVTYPLIREYKSTLMKLPPRLKTAKAYRNKTIQEVLNMDIKKRMTVPTINKYLNRLATLLAYAMRNGWMSLNPAAGLQLKEKRRDDELRTVFTLDDLRSLFHSPQYLNDTHKHPYQFWVLPIALFTGMRQNEIAQLHLDDIRQDNDIWVFDINANKPDKHIKTKTSKRLVPMHPFLSETLNLPAYVQSLKDQGQIRLFPEILHKRDRYGQTISRWFNGNSSTSSGYKRKCGIIIEEGAPKKDFHSFRHTLIDHLKQKLVDDNLLHELDGHAHKSMSLGKYGKQYHSEVMLEHAVAHIDFHEAIKLAHLAKSKFVKHPHEK
nr:site-specific integrase [Pseudodesulfovibrio sp.]